MGFLLPQFLNNNSPNILPGAEQTLKAFRKLSDITIFNGCINYFPPPTFAKWQDCNVRSHKRAFNQKCEATWSSPFWEELIIIHLTQKMRAFARELFFVKNFSIRISSKALPLKTSQKIHLTANRS